MLAKRRNQTILNDVWEISGRVSAVSNQELFMLHAGSISAMRRRCS